MSFCLLVLCSQSDEEVTDSEAVFQYVFNDAARKDSLTSRNSNSFDPTGSQLFPSAPTLPGLFTWVCLMKQKS